MESVLLPSPSSYLDQKTKGIVILGGQESSSQLFDASKAALGLRTTHQEGEGTGGEEIAGLKSRTHNKRSRGPGPGGLPPRCAGVTHTSSSPPACLPPPHGDCEGQDQGAGEGHPAGHLQPRAASAQQCPRECGTIISV